MNYWHTDKTAANLDSGTAKEYIKPRDVTMKTTFEYHMAGLERLRAQHMY